MAVLAEQTVEMAVQQIILGVKDKEVPQERGDRQLVRSMLAEAEAEEEDRVLHTLLAVPEEQVAAVLAAGVDTEYMQGMMSIAIIMAQTEWLEPQIQEAAAEAADITLMKIRTVDVIMDIRPKVGLELY